ncbi:MAG: GYD domain-containing protein [Acidimicrobiales bacterium]
MPKYLLELKYSVEGAKGIKAKGGTARVAMAKELIEGLGGKVESFNFAFGGFDAYVVVELPDEVSALAGAMAVNAGGGATVSTVQLLTPAQVDEAAAKQTTYRPPGS